MIKNIIVSNVGLNRYNIAKEYKDLLYKSYKEGSLPKGIDEYFNFDYFKWEDKNIGGYEWYADLPEDKFSSSFTMLVYYLYTAKDESSGTLYAYTYKEDIDFKKLHNDVIRVLEGRIQSDLEILLNK